MFRVSVKAVRELSMQRLQQEIAMCQRLCEVIDKHLGAYMTILGRLSVLNLMHRLEELPEVKRAPLFKRWADEAHNYGPWTLIRHKLKKEYDHKLPEELDLKLFLNPDQNRLLDPGFPWGALTLGGFMRAYAEMSEFAYDEVKDRILPLTKKTKDGLSTGVSYGKSVPSIGGKDGWQQTAIMEDQGRLSWQRNLIKMYGYDLFAKKQVQPDGLSPGEKKLPKPEQKKIQEKKRLEAQPKVTKVEQDVRPRDDRMRYVRAIKDDAVAAAWAKDFQELEPKWTQAGRVKWQTFLLDRVSLIGDLFGLVRGATISGTTSDHAYSLFQLCHDVSVLKDQDPRYAILTRGPAKLALGSGSWANQSTKELQAAFAELRTDEGFGRIVRMMMLLPVTQMGIEMHHSVHEMASVIGLNDLVNWHVGYYDTLFMTLEELRRLENSELAKMRRAAKIHAPTMKDGPMLKNTGALAEVENEIKKVLQETTKDLPQGYFVTVDPYTVTLDDAAPGGVVMRSETHRKLHRQHALLGQKRMADLNKEVTTGTKLAHGITMEYVQSELKDKHNFTLSPSSPVAQDADSAYDELYGRSGALELKKKRKASRAIKEGSETIWTRYKAACTLKS